MRSGERTRLDSFQLRIMHASGIRGTLIVFLFLVYLCAFPTLAPPMLTWEFYIAAAITAVLTVWGLWIGANPYRCELQFVLYAGVLGLGMAVASHMSMYKIMYSIVHLHGSWFIWLAGSGNVLLIGFMAFYYDKAFHDGTYYRLEQGSKSPKGSKEPKDSSS
ncbi:MAG: hypothetical protein E7L01_00980 [Paenibacillus macerans]|uniref:Putative membrane protein n=3 Tax=Paenibacillus macerans TaxID=44252 RepID=A0A090XU92_PAEMA|nr:hypothetical protein [Paenibacillus macerans]KFM83685.1 putative membrane protein [Paenibacillus macerans]MBS5910307.1 hypothetical protein [Paenibacillus macerans]MCY7559634.1 intracellular growth attenuator family protein [Paenibacillus macerans]MDU5947643.1 hypothetical protein [Paenibacillus macerans]MDU7471919.1 hypothetical protein [Paenibacillus macerans]